MTTERYPDESDQDYSDRMHRENSPHYISDDEICEPDDDGEDDYEMQIECPYCDGDGWVGTDQGGVGLYFECPECGGSGWQ
jgi:DnaJ-class molecular chaperone